jgi:hypothetical protein
MERSGDMSNIDWLNTPLNRFHGEYTWGPEGRTTGWIEHPLGEGAAQAVMENIALDIRSYYEDLLDPEIPEDSDMWDLWEIVRRDGTKERVDHRKLTLADLPDVLNTLALMQEKFDQRKREEMEHKQEERKERERVRAKERRKLKKLGEW